jgi:hypothetical protein
MADMKGFTRTGIPKEISVAMRGWTKWGGPNHGYFSQTTGEWNCQACGERQVESLPAYLIKITESEFARICSTCFYTSLLRKIKNIFDLIDLTRTIPNDYGC